MTIIRIGIGAGVGAKITGKTSFFSFSNVSSNLGEHFLVGGIEITGSASLSLFFPLNCSSERSCGNRYKFTKTVL